MLAGAERADSIVVNPHKWLFTPIDCSALFCRRPDVLKRAFSLVPSYLQTPEGTAVENYMDWGPQLGRRFRALKLWMVLRAFGRSGIEARLREHMRLGRLFAEGHASLRDDLEVTIPELDTLVELAYENGAVAARMTGGGFGGAIVALVDRERVEHFTHGVVEEYARRYDQSAAAYVCEASDGARELT